MPLTIETLLRIRRKVDKATKRADEQRAMGERAWTLLRCTKNWLGSVTIPASALANTADDNLGYDLTVGVAKGDYSTIYPATLAPCVDRMVRPQIVCADAFDASWVARPSMPSTQSAIEEMAVLF